MVLPRFNRLDRALGLLALAAADPGALNLQAVNMPDSVTLGGMAFLIYGLLAGDKRVEAKVAAELSMVSGKVPADVDDIEAAEAVEQCRRAEIDPEQVAAGVARWRARRR